MTRHRPKRFKVQRRVEIWARDRSDKPFLLGAFWRTLQEADRQPTAEKGLAKQRHDRPHGTFRIAEEWPIGATLRPLLTVRPKRIAIGFRGQG